MLNTAVVAVFYNRPRPPDLKDLVGKIAPRPLFLINAAEGIGGEVELNAVFLRAAREPKAPWTIRAGSRTGGIRARPAEYERRVLGFFDRALPG